MAIIKSIGVTPTEQLLADLCDSTFLKIWSYSNPYKADGKELCDVMAVFENHVFLFFDRESRKFDNTNGDLKTQWSRWYKTVIEAQIKTSAGAKRYILERPDQVFLDCKATVPFPIPLPSKKAIVHNIIVAHGAAEACKNASPDNVTGSLAMGYHKPGLPTMDAPFCVFLDSTEPVHVLDTCNLEIILKELDTVHDFTAYLTAKEEAIRKFDAIYYCGEEDLLANYFSNFDEALGKYYIATKRNDVNWVSILEGEWQRFIQTPAYLRRKAANKISEIWDKLIQRTSENALKDVLGGNGNVFNGESALHEMAKEPRLSRRVISELMTRSINNFPGDGQSFMRNLSILPSFYKNKSYVFLQVHDPNIKDYENEYRPLRQDLLKLACGVAKNKRPHLEMVIGIAIDAPKFTSINSEDFILMPCREWSEADREHFDYCNEGIDFLKTDNITKGVFTTKEFPEADDFYKSKKIGRNEPCPCGSGNKYKKCCLK